MRIELFLTLRCHLLIRVIFTRDVPLFYMKKCIAIKKKMPL